MRKNITLSKVSFIIFSYFIITSASGQWVAVGPLNGPGFNVNDLQVFGTDLYAGGASTNGKKGISKWDGISWTPVAKVYPKYNQFTLGINTLTVYNSQLCAGGIVDSIAGIKTGTSDVVSFDGSTWAKLGSNPPDIIQVNCMKVFNNELYVGGQGLNKWDGTSWTSISSHANTTGSITAIEVYNNELYVGGNFTQIGGINLTQGTGFAKWDGITWSTPSAFYDTLSFLPNVNVASVACMITFKGELYAVGDIAWAGAQKVRAAARWNGTSWRDVAGGWMGNGAPNANSLTTDANNLYMVGAIQKVGVNNDSAAFSARFDGTSWHPMLVTPAPYSYDAVENYNGEIYAAYQSMSKWTQTTSGISYSGLNDNYVDVYPNPSYGIVNISDPEKKIERIKVLNQLGEIIYEEAVDSPSTSFTIDLKNIPSGIYYLNAFASNKSYVKKIFLRN